jgi:hypothetical protein
MEQLHEFLQTLLSTASYELHLEPNRKPYVVSSSGETDVSDTPLIGTQISMMVFPLIPPDVKQELPDQPQIEFIHPHNLGRFNFIVRKSPSGFNVTVYPIYGEILRTEPDADSAGGYDVDTDCAQEFDPKQFGDIGSELSTESSDDASAFEALVEAELPTEGSNSFDGTFKPSEAEPHRTVDPLGGFDEQSPIVHSKPIGDDLAFSVCFARFFATEIRQNSSVKKPLSITQRGWAYSTTAALTQTAKVFAFGCKFEGEEKSDAVLENHSGATPTAIIAKWDWNHEDIFGEGNVLEKLRTSCTENANAAAFLQTFCMADDYDVYLQKVAAFWASAFRESQNPPVLFLHTIVFEQSGEMREFARLRSVEIDIDYLTVLNDLPF